MSSTLDDIACPHCGNAARRKQDNKSGNVDIDCFACGYTSHNGEVGYEGGYGGGLRKSR